MASILGERSFRRVCACPPSLFIRPLFFRVSSRPVSLSLALFLTQLQSDQAIENPLVDKDAMDNSAARTRAKIRRDEFCHPAENDAELVSRN